MRKANLIFSIVLMSGFLVFVGHIIWDQWNSKKQAFKESFSGMVISTMEQKRNPKYTTSVTVEIVEKDWICLVVISPIKPGGLYPCYRDSIFKEVNSNEIFLKRGQEDLVLLDGISCLDIEHSIKKIRNP